MFRGSMVHLLVNALLYILLIGILVSVGLMGEEWARFFALTLAVALPAALPVAALAGWANRFTPDDGKGVLTRPGGTRIPYQRVRSVLLVERGGTLDVYAKLGTLRTATLVQMLPARERQRLLDELARCLPGVPVRTRRWPRPATAAIVAMVLIAGFSGAHAFLFHRHPALRVAPVVLEGAAPPIAAAGRTGKASDRTGKRTAGTRSRLGGFRFTVPDGFEFTGEREGALSFTDERRRIRLEAVANVKHEELERHAAWFRYGMGVEDYAGLAAMIFRARYGLVPLTLRSIALFRLEDVALYETGPPHLRSFITQGRRGKYEHAYLLFAGEQTGGEIHVFVSGVTRMSREELHALAARFETADVQVKEAPAGSRRR